jgi:hypothetical protein
MAALAGTLTPVGNPLHWSLLFARQPEPDLEFTEEELDQTSAAKPVPPMKPGKKSGGGRSLLWILLLALVVGIGYIAMEPEQLTEWLAPLLGESTPPEPTPPIAMRPKPTIPAPVAPPEPAAPAPGDLSSAPTAPTATAPVPAAPGSPTQPPSTPAPFPSTTAPAATAISSPIFAEGQKVTVIGNPMIPDETIPLTLDASGSIPGPVVRPGVTLSILDGDLQPGGWVYSVQTDDGTKGWISENRLRLKF